MSFSKNFLETPLTKEKTEVALKMERLFMRKLNQILLIDDDDVNNFLNERILNKLEISKKITVVKNGQEGLNIVKANCVDKNQLCPDLIILDFMMPVMDGMEFMKEINKLNLPSPKQMVVLLLGVNLSEEVIDEFLSLGVQEYTSKPLSEETVMDSYNKYWGEKGLIVG